MGGKALSVPSVPMNREEFDNIAAWFTKRLDVSGTNYFIARSYKQKQTFNDLDILLENDGRDWNAYIQQTFNPREIVNAQNDADQIMYSFNHDNRQVDFIIFNKEYFKGACFFFSCGMMGELFGRISNTLGLKFGYYGLEYRHYNKNEKLGTVRLTQDPLLIMHVFGMNAETYLQGIETLNDMFDFIISSPLFNAYFCDLDRMSHDKRAKVKRRKEYVAFLAYLKQQGVPEKPLLTQPEQLDWIDRNFPEAKIRERIVEFEASVALATQAKERFNATHLMERFGWKGAELRVLRTYQETFESMVDYYKYILTADPEQLFKEVYALKQ